ncbi:SpaH/EbpB family LPXTG-anchored major pilin [Actinomyces minihominis]|uniref:SpaH/EbpB family LPXTG-anchored major pilin n=1 Tax=Actinomyces minihominis TaxID=2002838 RepID=UPI000C074986|nr:SpaH/EbpB family LPXTG-anchored major pilin [Actinomyces minihominis]
MKDTKGTAGRKALASMGAVALGLVGVAGLATSAIAADLGNIDPNADSSLTIHKHIGLPTDLDNNGVELGDVLDLDVAKGIKFKVQEVGVLDQGLQCAALEVTQAEDWNLIVAAYDTDPADWGSAKGSYCFTETEFEGETDEKGELKFDSVNTPNFGLGFYYITETDSSNAVIPGVPDQGVTVVQPVEPFFVTVPYPSYSGETGANHVWTYDVHVYPKNQKSDAPGKVIEKRPDSILVGSNLTWTITVPIPNTLDPLTEASVYDQLATELKFTDTTIVKIGGVEYTGDGLTRPAADAAGQVVWSFTGDALAAVNAARSTSDATIEVTFTTEVVSVPGEGLVENAPGTPGNGYGSSFNSKVTGGENTPESYWGQLSILKTDDSATARVLEGAEFKVFEKGTEGCAAEAPASGEIATGTSGPDGVVLWDGTNPASAPLDLWIGNWSNVEDDMAPKNPSKDYCVYETKAPVGYVAGTIANPVTITPGTIAEGEFTFTVVNAQQDGPDLPNTGASGTLLMIIGGTALVLLSGGLYLVQRRRTKA